eukprot:CAMPEP_0202078988 /NCGR_PEP_ID=MMETSP0964-20121228/6237_1 /ASSEMBLY_ACC=CAM_ASM_000500 /TAXON_ID=4773 /ORGANISM="Schizochytrium aggregatum, Strain ATCC28209" /LENGTH=299 /DNA_ID=CAMNT_0048646313 /DNA_START=109 /DNA_END=1006 /DNA_ORIENTATION=-
MRMCKAHIRIPTWNAADSEGRCHRAKARKEYTTLRQGDHDMTGGGASPARTCKLHARHGQRREDGAAAEDVLGARRLGRRQIAAEGRVLERAGRAAHDDGGRALHGLCLAARGDVGDRAAQHALVDGGGALDHSHGRRLREAGLPEARHERVHARDRHEVDGGAAGRVRGDLAGHGVVHAVAGGDEELVRDAARGDRDARGERRREAARDAGHDLDGEAGLAEDLDLLGAAAVEERVAALEAHDVEALAQGVERPFVQLVLGLVGAALVLARQHQAALHERQRLARHEEVGALEAHDVE